MKKVKPKEEVVQSSMRLARGLWEILNNIASDSRLSMAQCVERAIARYCYEYGTNKERVWVENNFGFNVGSHRNSDVESVHADSDYSPREREINKRQRLYKQAEREQVYREVERERQGKKGLK